MMCHLSHCNMAEILLILHKTLNNQVNLLNIQFAKEKYYKEKKQTCGKNKHVLN